MMLLAVLSACTSTCGTLEISGVPVTYVSDGKDLDVNGTFRDFCRAGWKPPGTPQFPANYSGTLFTYSPDVTGLPFGTVEPFLEWQSKNRQVDTDVALWWDTRWQLDFTQFEEGATLTTVPSDLVYDPVIKPGDTVDGPIPFAFGRASSASFTIEKIKVIGDCDRVDVRASYTIAWGEESDGIWAAAEGDDWWHFQEPGFYCSRRD